jgi:hypothetical protein
MGAAGLQDEVAAVDREQPVAKLGLEPVAKRLTEADGRPCTRPAGLAAQPAEARERVAHRARQEAARIISREQNCEMPRGSSCESLEHEGLEAIHDDVLGRARGGERGRRGLLQQQPARGIVQDAREIDSHPPRIPAFGQRGDGDAQALGAPAAARLARPHKPAGILQSARSG